MSRYPNPAEGGIIDKAQQDYKQKVDDVEMAAAGKTPTSREAPAPLAAGMPNPRKKRKWYTVFDD